MLLIEPHHNEGEGVSRLLGFGNLLLLGRVGDDVTDAAPVDIGKVGGAAVSELAAKRLLEGGVLHGLECSIVTATKSNIIVRATTTTAAAHKRDNKEQGKSEEKERS